MTSRPANSSEVPSKAIAALSEELVLPVHHVQEIYSRELDRLAAQARVPTFLSILAFRNTRSMLRRQSRYATRR